jgi:hypothetical protein
MLLILQGLPRVTINGVGLSNYDQCLSNHGNKYTNELGQE